MKGLYKIRTEHSPQTSIYVRVSWRVHYTSAVKALWNWYEMDGGMACMNTI